MNDNSAVATKGDIKGVQGDIKGVQKDIQKTQQDIQKTHQDIQMVQQDIRMVLDAMHQMGKDIDGRFKEIDQRFDKRIEASDLHTRILIEDLEERVLGANTDQFSVHTDKLENHEERIVDLETQPACV